MKTNSVASAMRAEASVTAEREIAPSGTIGSVAFQSVFEKAVSGSKTSQAAGSISQDAATKGAPEATLESGKPDLEDSPNAQMALAVFAAMPFLLQNTAQAAAPQATGDSGKVGANQKSATLLASGHSVSLPQTLGSGLEAPATALAPSPAAASAASLTDSAGQSPAPSSLGPSLVTAAAVPISAAPVGGSSPTSTEPFASGAPSPAGELGEVPSAMMAGASQPAVPGVPLQTNGFAVSVSVPLAGAGQSVVIAPPQQPVGLPQRVSGSQPVTLADSETVASSALWTAPATRAPRETGTAAAQSATFAISGQERHTSGLTSTPSSAAKSESALGQRSIPAGGRSGRESSSLQEGVTPQGSDSYSASAARRDSESTARLDRPVVATPAGDQPAGRAQVSGQDATAPNAGEGSIIEDRPPVTPDDSTPAGGPVVIEAAATDPETLAPTVRFPDSQSVPPAFVRMEPSATIRTEPAEAAQVLPGGLDSQRQGLGDVSDQIVARASMFSTSTGGGFNMRLDPPELGAIEVRLVVEAGTVTLRVAAESARARDLIESGWSRLQSGLADCGLKVEHLSVSHSVLTGAGQGPMASGNSDARQDQSWRNYRWLEEEDAWRRPLVASASHLAEARVDRSSLIDYRV